MDQKKINQNNNGRERNRSNNNLMKHLPYFKVFLIIPFYLSDHFEEFTILNILNYKVIMFKK